MTLPTESKIKLPDVESTVLPSILTLSTVRESLDADVADSVVTVPTPVTNKSEVVVTPVTCKLDPSKVRLLLPSIVPVEVA